MGVRRVRVYQGPENMNLIGFSASAVPSPEDGFENFMETKGYTVERLTNDKERYDTVVRSLGGVSAAYFGIEPPLRDEDTGELVRWCRDNIDTSHDGGTVIDNRMTQMPMEPLQYWDQEKIADF